MKKSLLTSVINKPFIDESTYQTVDFTDTIAFNVLNNPFQLDASYNMKLFLNDDLVYQGEYRDFMLISVPRYKYGKTVEILLQINDTRDPQVIYSSEVGEFIIWRKDLNEIALVYLVDNTKIESGMLFIASEYHLGK